MKKKIINSLMAFLLVFPAIVGLDALYSAAWYLLGLPTGWWTSVLLAVIAGVSEYAIICWIGRPSNEI